MKLRNLFFGIAFLFGGIFAAVMAPIIFVSSGVQKGVDFLTELISGRSDIAKQRRADRYGRRPLTITGLDISADRIEWTPTAYMRI